MSDIRKHSATSNWVRVLLKNSSTGVPLTGLAYNSSGLIISTICDVEASATAYTVAGSNVETISTLGTFAAPSANKCRFKEVDATNHPGIYEIQIADARFSVANAKRIVISWSGATNLLSGSYEIVLDPDVNTNKLGGTAQTGRDIGASVLLSAGTGTGQLDFTSGVVKSNLVQILATALTETAGYLAAGFKKFFNVASPTSTMNQITLVDTTTTNTDMRGTDGANTTTPPTAAAVADAVWDEASTGHTDAGKAGAQVWTKVDAIAVDVAGLDGAPMRGTDNAALATVCTETRLAELDAANLPAVLDTVATDVAGLDGDAMRGTDGAYTGTPPTAAAVADAVWDELSTGHTDAGKAGAQLWIGVDNLLARLGAWTGSGINTVLGAFKAFLSKDASAPSDIGGTFAPATDSTEALRDRGDAAWTTATGFSTLDAAGVRTAVGMATANLDTQLSTISTAAVLARKLKTGNIRDKSGSPGVYEILDDDDATVIATLTLAETTPYQQVTLS